MPRIEHVALWTHDLERARGFYERFLGAHAGVRYENAATGFASYFLSLEDGARLELMQLPGIAAGAAPEQRTGWVHVAISLGSEERVDALTAELAREGHRVLDGPRRTGDGYYESVVLDPDGNRLELTV
ncbi:MAG TPA: VOC family protein [Gaiellaceae bacterium]|nr:VOC family protein [Gaiellaceae bacterium]